MSAKKHAVVIPLMLFRSSTKIFNPSPHSNYLFSRAIGQGSAKVRTLQITFNSLLCPLLHSHPYMLMARMSTIPATNDTQTLVPNQTLRTQSRARRKKEREPAAVVWGGNGGPGGGGGVVAAEPTTTATKISPTDMATYQQRVDGMGTILI